MKVKSEREVSPVQLLVTPWTGGYQAPPSMGFSRQEYWSGVTLPSPKEHRGVVKAKEGKLGKLMGWKPLHEAISRRGYGQLCWLDKWPLDLGS